MYSLCIKAKPFTFQYSFTKDGKQQCSSEQIHLPFETNVTVREYANIFGKRHAIPQYLEKDLYQKLFDFVHEKIDELQCEKTNALLEQQEKWADKAETLLANLTNQRTKIARNEDNFHENDFYLMYHKIIHSGVLTLQLIRLETHNSQVIRDMLKEKEAFLLNLTKEQSLEIEDILLDSNYSENEINLIAKKNVLRGEKCRKDLSAKILKIRNDQKKEFYSWIKNTYEDLVKNSKQLPREEHKTALDSPEKIDSLLDFETDHDDEMLQESYTINLGSQLKTTHNLRLISADILRFCNNICTPQRIHTAMTLYSNTLSAVVLLVDSSGKIHSGS